jgi:hypothetical protein
VWTSWKAMTKHKSEIANGVRLENASWRTWAKQRSQLKTISPETLNWFVCPFSFLVFQLVFLQRLSLYRLKDSDVTWLYVRVTFRLCR